MPLPVAPQWFKRRTVDAAITLLWEPHANPLIRCNIWHVRGRDRDLLVDTGLGIASLRAAAPDLFGHPVIAVATHTHYDHSGGMAEFADRGVHAAELTEPVPYDDFGGLLKADFSPEIQAAIEAEGEPLPDCLIDAIPHAGFRVEDDRTERVIPTRVLAEGDGLDLGDRRFEVLHLPGHSPGSIGLYERATETLFSGDAIYDGPLIDTLPGSDVEAYGRTMRRLLELPVRTVHAGHDPSFDGKVLKRLARAYLLRARRPANIKGRLEPGADRAKSEVARDTKPR